MCKPRSVVRQNISLRVMLFVPSYVKSSVLAGRLTRLGPVTAVIFVRGCIARADLYGKYSCLARHRPAAIRWYWGPVTAVIRPSVFLVYVALMFSGIEIPETSPRAVITEGRGLIQGIYCCRNPAHAVIDHISYVVQGAYVLCYTSHLVRRTNRCRYLKERVGSVDAMMLSASYVLAHILLAPSVIDTSLPRVS